MSQQPVPDHAAPAQTASGGTPQGRTAPDGTAPGGTAPGEATPSGAAPGRTAPSGTTPSSAAPGPTAPGPTAPGPTAPSGTAPGGAELEAPHLDFDGTTPYEDYVQASVLTHLQRPLSDDPGEMVFLVTTQVMELWFTVIVHEWHTAAQALREDDLPTAMAALQRSAYELESLNASWTPLAHLTPGQFNAYRSALGEGSGFQSAMYRRLEFLLGEKSASMLVPHRGAPRVHAELEKALTEPSLYDEVLRYLARRGLAVPAAVLDRDPALRYEPDPGVERVWEEIYSGPREGELVRLGEALTEVAELVWRWRNDHLVATRRAMGAKTGTGGSAGVAWLEKRAGKTVFPELWTARSHV
ncbi:tryptophan 2,3-dioxygenase family protein [Streptomyces violaceusniger]|uniref:Tryptophan 2,3-dioxygenase n=1 Tax=Streptomyces violaceusniger (strain Tu 4113) TaxID=653045 RepID=G2P9Y8_STRV4|nr:tryptophan 2,3-dioxygenase family protein [Streptomyces violaceusniger]AEM80279.1 tryptophan 23-dioxygenase [Streptomyces violaceusniger Tu 4113]